MPPRRFPRPSGGIVIVSYPFVLRTSGAAAPPSKPRAGASLTRSQIQTTMRRLARPLRQCFDRHRQSGTLRATVTIQPHGRVSRVDIKGRFGGTPMGACVAAVVRAARFPRFGGKPITITYPFVFR